MIYNLHWSNFYLVEDVDDVWKDDVALDDWLEGRLYVDLNELPPAGREVAVPLPDPGIHPLVARGCLVYSVSVKLKTEKGYM